jgi:P-type conjugative transfer protein TrbJ
MQQWWWRGTLTLWLFLALPGRSWGSGIPVVDAALNALGLQQFAQQMRDYAVMLKQLENEAQQLRNQMQQILYAYTSVQQGVTNLARLDLNNAAQVMGLFDQLQAKIAQANAIGYTVQGAIDGAQRLYPQVSAMLDQDKQRVLQLQWAAAQRDSAKIALQTQAIRDSQAVYQRKWAEVLAAAAAAQGNLQIEQANAQALGLLGGQLAAIEQQLATQGREQSQQALKQAATTEMQQRITDQALETLDTTQEMQPGKVQQLQTGRGVL